MARYIILSRFAPDAFVEASEFKTIAKQVSQKIKEDCPDIKWLDSYATLGRFDVIDLVEAENPKDVERAAMIIRGLGHSTTETLPGTPWKEFLESL